MSLEAIERNYPGESPQKLVVFLHGYGADGNDLISLAPYFETALKKADFVSPHAPFPCDESPFGRQWFSLLNRDPSVLQQGLENALPFLNDFLDKALASRQLSDSDLCLIGFSQGTMMALSCALQRPKACAAVLGYSGAFLSPQLEPLSKPPVLLIHGTADPVVPFKAMAKAHLDLQKLGLTVETTERPGLQHGIDEEGLNLGASFLKKCFDR